MVFADWRLEGKIAALPSSAYMVNTHAHAHANDSTDTQRAREAPENYLSLTKIKHITFSLP